MPLIKAPAKINIGLHIGPLRVDGYHNIETFMQTIDLCDELEITEADDFDFKVTGYEFPPQQENICVKAYQTLSSYVGIEKPVSMKLHKRIPISAGLGGGSSDGAAVIMELIHLWNLRLTPDEKREIGLKVGADVPFFLLAPEGTAFCSGRGEIVEPWESIWSGWVVVVFTGVEISTKWAYKMFDENLTISKKILI
jgi:4-diphosphocytidyl-2-C-methyl-D-erythritol kinase